MTDELTKDDLDELERLLGQATPGPWEEFEGWLLGGMDGSIHDELPEGDDDPDGVHFDALIESASLNISFNEGLSSDEDLEFITTLRNFAPALISLARAHLEARESGEGLVERLEAERDEAVGLISALNVWFRKTQSNDEGGHAGANYLNGDSDIHPGNGWEDIERIAEKGADFLAKHKEAGADDT